MQGYTCGMLIFFFIASASTLKDRKALWSACSITHSLWSNRLTIFAHQRSNRYKQQWWGTTSYVCTWRGWDAALRDLLLLITPRLHLLPLSSKLKAKECVCWHSTPRFSLHVPDLSPRSEGCLLSCCQEDTASNKAAAAAAWAGQLHSSPSLFFCYGKKKK